jgi:hypothetical protein
MSSIRLFVPGRKSSFAVLPCAQSNTGRNAVLATLAINAGVTGRGRAAS